jgi:hypothetical protein
VIGSVGWPELNNAAGGVLQAAVPAELQIDTAVAVLSDVADTWSIDTGRPRLVYLTNR